MNKHLTRPSMESQANASMAAAATSAPVHSPAAAAPTVHHSPAPVPSAAYQQPSMGSNQIYQSALQRRASNFGPQAAQAPYQAPQGTHPYAAAQSSPYMSYNPSRLQAAPGAAGIYNANAPRPIEVFHLSDAANAAIPADIRSQFHTDDRGHVLFFSSAPVDVIPPTQQTLGHSLKYLATRDERRARVESHKRKQVHEADELEARTKRARAAEETALTSRVETLTNKAIEATTAQIKAGTDKLYESLYGADADTARQADSTARERGGVAERAARAQTARIRGESTKAGVVDLRGNAMYLDDIDPRG